MLDESFWCRWYLLAPQPDEWGYGTLKDLQVFRDYMVQLSKVLSWVSLLDQA